MYKPAPTWTARLGIVLILLAGAALARGVAMGATATGVSSPPPELQFIYHGEWWMADSFSAEAASYRTVAGDFDGDGLGDVAMLHRTNSTTMRFYVLRGAGDHFVPAQIWLVVSGFLNADMVTGRVVAGDFNNDGFDDIAAFAADSETLLYVFLSDGVGAFSYHEWWNDAGSYAAQITGRVVAGDFDGDGWHDDVVALYDETGEPGDDTIRADVFVSDGSAFAYQADWWSRGAFIPGNATHRTVAGDWDADGDDDVAMIYEYASTEMHVNVLESTGSAFVYQSKLFVHGGYIATRTTGRVAAGDFDGDGDDDITLLYDYSTAQDDIIRAHVLLSTRRFVMEEGFSYQGSVPGWWESSSYIPANATGRVVAGDWDGDGVDDVGMIYDTDVASPSVRAQVLEATAPAPEPPTTRLVDGDDPGCSDAGGASFCTIQAAVDAASDGDIIQVAGGTYFELVSLPKYAEPGFNQQLTIQGAGAANTIVDGGDGGTVFTVHPGGQVTLSDLTIRNGSSGGGGGIRNDGGILTVGNSAIIDSAALSGGGILNRDGGTLTLISTSVSGNSAKGGGGLQNDEGVVTVNGGSLSGNSANSGGGIWNKDTMTVTGSTLTNNIASDDGGGVYSNKGVLALHDTTLHGNSATDDGGAILVYSGTLTVTHGTLDGNTAGGNGAGIYNDVGVLTMRYSTVLNNVTANDAAGFYNRGPATLTDSSFSGNIAGDDGGAILNASDGALTVSNVTIDGNTAGDEGGGIRSGGAMTLTNTTLNDNQADTGGGIISFGTMTLINSTLSGNMADVLGGGLFAGNGSASTLANNIIANSASGGDCAVFGAWDTAGGPNLDSDGTCTGFTLTGDPLLGPLHNNGGPTQTHGLLDGSPAIDAGSNAVCPESDQRGIPRPQDGDGNGTAVCDLGAYEVGNLYIFLPVIQGP